MPAQRRFEVHQRIGNPLSLSRHHPAVRDGRTLFPSRVRDVGEARHVLVSGQNNRKLGKQVMVGRWAGMPIYTLTLEERATCPRSCGHWNDCMGNKSQWPARWRHGPALEDRIEFELAWLSRKHRGWHRRRRGFVVRLHILGDFYSLDYVARWAGWVRQFSALHIFGYTAHLPGTPIGDAVARLSAAWDRVCIRHSEGGGTRGTITVLDETEARDRRAFACPAQTGRSDCCATCGACWAKTTKPIAFLQH